MGVIPIDQRKADMADPEQHFGWALSLIPAPEAAEGMPDFIPPVLVLPAWSQHLWDCGFRHHPDLQTIEQDVDESAALRSAGVRWVPVGTRRDADGDLQVDLTGLSDEEAAAVRAALERRGRGD